MEVTLGAAPDEAKVSAEGRGRREDGERKEEGEDDNSEGRKRRVG